MKEVIVSTAANGLQWTNHMQELVELEVKVNTECVSETETGLHKVIIIASTGEHCDLETIYNLLKRVQM